jgi:hypothetical protein
MKKITFLVFFGLVSSIYSQKKSNGPENVSSNQFDLSIASGIASPSSNFSDNAFAANGNFFELSPSYYFSKLGVGLSLGQFSNPTESNFSDKTNSLAFPTINSTEDWKTTYYGAGPEYKMNFNRINATFLTRIGMMAIKPINLKGGYDIDNADFSSTVIDYGTSETSNLSYYSAGIKLGYEIIPNLSLFVKANYLSSLSKEINISERIKRINDINKNGVIDQEDFVGADGTPIDFETSTKNVKPQTLNYGVGLTWHLNTTKKTDNPVKQKAKVEVRGWDEKDKSASPKTKGRIVFTNPSKEKKDQERKLINILPKNNSVFKDSKEIKNFTWELIGERIPNPQYIIEVVKISANQQPQRTFISQTVKTSFAESELFKGEKLSDGQYRWKVTETTTGTSSNSSFFSMSNCEIDFTVSNEEIECLGYEGENRKYKICFDSTYSSSSGNLTFANIGSGLTVFDQTYAPLTFTLVSPNPTLQTQIGATPSTVSYCFEVVVPNSVTSIGFGLQGDDLDPSPILCQPGVSSLFDELPDCLCDDCKDIELSFDNFNISLNAPYGNQFNFNGNINVNVPIYGIEFQIQSYSYTANPSACSEGVSSVEESGMILMPGTTINSSTSLQLFNETASNSANTNNNATKDIKYTSNTPLTGPIPVNLTIGLPGPISGLDPSCCVIDYRVCIKVRIFYEKDSCKSCVFTHCFEFNNQ